MFVKTLLIGFIISVICAWIFKRHQVKRGDWVENKQRGNFGLVLEVDPTRKGLLVNFMNPQTRTHYTEWFNMNEFQTQKGIELE